MDQIKYRTLREAPAEVRKSLEILDDIIDECSLSLEVSSSQDNARQLDDVPSEVRHSLELLDDILDKFEEEGKKLDEIELSIDTIEILKDENLLSENVERSLQVLDSTLDEIVCDSKVHLRIGDQSSIRKSRHEDIRRSLEVLDSVLAEFDDCLDSWDSSGTPAECKFSESIPELRKKFERIEDQPNRKLSNGLSKSQGRLPLEKFSLDGAASHNSSNSASEQFKVSSPPPIPKRSPTTKLSEEKDQQQNRFTFPSDDTSLEDCFDDSEGPLSQKISTLSPQKNGDARPPCDRLTSDKCSHCGRGLKAVIMEVPSGEPSPFMQKRQVFEPKVHQELSPGPSVGRSRSFKVKRMVAEIMDSSTEPSSLPADISFESSSSSCSVRDCDCRDRIRHLNEKFAETKRLLRVKKIKVLDCDPPPFVPPPPGDDAVVPHTGRLDDPSEDQSFYSADVSNNCVSSSQNEDSLLCNRCSNALSSHLNETIEDIPNLLPTDALNRPHLGFSYSMEEDLPPGVKEIQMTTSTPKSGVSPKPSLFRTKESNLSTFSQSVSSLGYVSSQSDLELNNISTVPDKVPVSTFKSMTLPNGLDRSPFYSAAEDDQTHQQKSWQNDHNDNRVRKSAGHMSVEELRSAQDGEEKPKKKHFRGFSRKSKKDKKNDDSLSLKSDISTDEGVILKKLSTLDGSSIELDAALADDKTGGGVEKKRWSLLRSIIGKKSP